MLGSLVFFYLVLICASAVGLALCLRSVEERRWYVGVFLLSVFLKILVILSVNIGLFGNELEHPDSGFYLDQIKLIRDEGRPLALQPSHFLNIFFLIFGDRVLFAEVANAALASFALLFLALSAKELFGGSAGKIASLLLLIDPAFNYWTVQLLKESVTVFAVGAAVFFFFSREKYVLLPASLFAFILLYSHDRSYFAFILALVLFLASFSAREQRVFRLSAYGAITVALLVLSVSPGLSALDSKVTAQQDVSKAEGSLEVVDEESAFQSPLDRLANMINSVRESNTQGHRPFFERSRVERYFSGGFDLVSFMSLAVFYGAFLPFPWHAQESHEMLFAISILYWYALIPFVLHGIYLSRRNVRSYVLSGYALGLFLLISYFVVSMGPFVRWRLTALLALYPFAALSLDSLTGAPKSKAKERPFRVAVLGTRGVPARYGGFETFAERLGEGLSARGISVSVFCPKSRDCAQAKYKGISRVVVPDYERYFGAVGTIVYDFHCLLKASLGRYEVIYMLGYSSSLFLPIPKVFAKTVCVNMDGLEWKRSKWGVFARAYLLFSEMLAVLFADKIIADSKALVGYYSKRYGVKAVYIPYGADIVTSADARVLKKFNLDSKEYFIVIARLEPENSIEMILDGFVRSESKKTLVVVGPVSNAYSLALKRRFEGKNVRFIGGIFDSALTDALRFHCFAYFHGHTVGGTNPSLLSAAGAGCQVVARDVVFNREVLGDCGFYFSSVDEVSRQIGLFESGRKIDGGKIRRIISDRYSWKGCVNSHDELFRRLRRDYGA